MAPSMKTTATGLKVASAGFDAIGKVSGDIGARRYASSGAGAALLEGNMSAEASLYNAVLAQQDAQLARDLAANRVASLEKTKKQHIGASRVSMAANGVDVNAAGTSPLQVMQQIAADYASQQEYEHWVGETEYTQKINEANQHIYQANQAQWEARVRAQSTLASAPGWMKTALGVVGAGLTIADAFGAFSSGAKSAMNPSAGARSSMSGSLDGMGNTLRGR